MAERGMGLKETIIIIIMVFQHSSLFPLFMNFGGHSQWLCQKSHPLILNTKLLQQVGHAFEYSMLLSLFITLDFSLIRRLISSNLFIMVMKCFFNY